MGAKIIYAEMQLGLGARSLEFNLFLNDKI